MSQMTPAQARVIDPILSTVVRGYKHPGNIGFSLFPAVSVPKMGGTRIEFGKEDFKAVNTIRAPGGRIAEVQFGHTGTPYALTSHALAGKVPQEHVREASGTPAADQMGRAARSVMAMMLLELEREQAVLATTAGNFPSGSKTTLTSTDQWSHDSSTPGQDIEEASEVVRGKIGVRPNTLVIGAKVLARLKFHPKLLEAFKYTSGGSVTEEQVKQYFGVPNFHVGSAITASQAGVFSDVWGDFAILAYTAIGAADMGEPSFGYTYELNGSPDASGQRWDADTKSWKTDVEYYRAPEIVGAEAGYLFSDCLA